MGVGFAPGQTIGEHKRQPPRAAEASTRQWPHPSPNGPEGGCKVLWTPAAGPRTQSRRRPWPGKNRPVRPRPRGQTCDPAEPVSVAPETQTVQQGWVREGLMPNHAAARLGPKATDRRRSVGPHQRTTGVSTQTEPTRRGCKLSAPMGPARAALFGENRDARILNVRRK